MIDKEGRISDYIDHKMYEIKMALRLEKNRKDCEERILDICDAVTQRVLMYKTYTYALTRYIEDYLGKEIDVDKFNEYLDYDLERELAGKQYGERREDRLRLLDEEDED